MNRKFCSAGLFSRGLVTLIATLGFASSANAITVSFVGEHYEIGTDVTNLFRGLTILTQGQGRNASSTFSPTASPTIVGNYFGTRAIAGGGDLTDIHSCYVGSSFNCLQGISFLDFVFDRPTDYFAYLPFFASEASTAMIFFSDGSYWNSMGLGSSIQFSEYCVTPESVGRGYGTHTIESDSADGGGCVVRNDAPMISRIWLQGNGFLQGAARFEYNVPEPGTLALLGLGLAGLGFARRRKPH